MRFKLVIKYIILILWMILIFWFSNQNGTISSEMSDGLISEVVKFIEIILKNSLDNEKIIEAFAFLIRKVAHFFLYFVLGILWMNLLKEHRVSLGKQVIYSLLFCIMYACSDEIHQLFIPGRSGNIIDTMIDTTGSLCSIITIYLFKKYKNKAVY